MGAAMALATMCASGTGWARCHLSDGEKAAVGAAAQGYIDAWIANDKDAVLALLSDTVVMIPHHGAPVRTGKDKVAEWWFPGGAVTAPILTYDRVTHEIDGCGELAFARGRLNELTYEYQGQVFRQADGNFLTLFRKTDQGDWLITHHIWNDPPTERN